ncbi:hypothetical protein FOA52_011147 [Chlamydomonas sp. UWO 241]|nr:hypothetical protein FOA52_011147 [Chlamydomonas sp. UWO 241]
MRPTLLAACLCLLSVLSVAQAKFWYGSDPLRLPTNTSLSLKSFFQTDTNDVNSTLLTVGVSWNMAMLQRAGELPTKSVLLPMPNPDVFFNYSFYEAPIEFFRTHNESEMAFQWLRATYSPSGTPVRGSKHYTPASAPALPSAPLGNVTDEAIYDTYAVPMWTLSFHLGDEDEWFNAWARSTLQTTKKGGKSCDGVLEEVWQRMYTPVVAECFTNGSYYLNADGENVTNLVQTGDGFQSIGSRLIDFTADEWNATLADEIAPSPVFNQSFAYGVMDGNIEFFQVMVSEAFLLNQTSSFTCIEIKGIPSVLRTGGKVPTSFCTRLVNGNNVVLEFRSFQAVAQGACDLATGAPAEESFYPDTLPVPSNCSLPGEAEEPVVIPSDPEDAAAAAKAAAAKAAAEADPLA